MDHYHKTNPPTRLKSEVLAEKDRQEKASRSAPCSACEEWREKWLSTRRYLRDANRGAETNAVALQLCGYRARKAYEKIQTLQMENRQLRKELDALKQNA
jgi:mannose-6-phosphate isomerase class I